MNKVHEFLGQPSYTEHSGHPKGVLMINKVVIRCFTMLVKNDLFSMSKIEVTCMPSFMTNL